VTAVGALRPHDLLIHPALHCHPEREHASVSLPTPSPPVWELHAMSIPFLCLGCKASYEVADELAGKEIRCRQCERRRLVEASAGSYVPFLCPHCREQTEVPASLVGHWLRCPNCQALAKVPTGGSQLLTRRRALFGAGAVLLAITTAGGIFWTRGRSRREGLSSEDPRRRSREQGPRGPADPKRGRRNRRGRNQGAE
jgi:phage FluMu protein Com